MRKLNVLASGLVALIASVVVNALLIAIFLPLTGVPANVMTFKVAGPTGFFTFMGVMGALVVFTIVRRFSRRPNRLFVWIAALVLLVSFLPDIYVHNLGPMFAQITVGGAVLLMAMHVACAVITVSTLTLLTKVPAVR